MQTVLSNSKSKIIPQPKSLRINFFVQYVYEQGTYFRFHNLALGLTQLGHSVTIWGTDFTKSVPKFRTQIKDGITYHIISGNKMQSLFGQHAHPITSIRRIFLKYPKADVNHMFQPFLTVATAWHSQFTNASLNVYDWDDLWTGGLYNAPPKSLAEHWSQKWVAYLEKFLPQKAQLVTVCSNYLLQFAKACNANDVRLLYNGFWPNKNIPNKTDARKQLGLNENAIYLGFMGRTHNEIEWCFIALSQVCKIYKNIRLAICGCGNYIFNNISPNLLNHIDYLGFLSPARAEVFAAAMDIGLLPLQDEPFNRSRFPIKLAHYQAMGTIVLYSNIGEAGKVAAELPWNLNAGATQLSWNNAFQEACYLAQANLLPKVNLQILEKALSWNVICKSLEEAYFSKLSA